MREYAREQQRHRSRYQENSPSSVLSLIIKPALPAIRSVIKSARMFTARSKNPHKATCLRFLAFVIRWLRVLGTRGGGGGVFTTLTTGNGVRPENAGQKKLAGYLFLLPRRRGDQLLLKMLWHLLLPLLTLCLLDCLLVLLQVKSAVRTESGCQFEDEDG